MAHFYGQISGNRGTASRIGTKLSGLKTYIRGWDIGVTVEMQHLSSLGTNGEDIAHVYITKGNNDDTRARIYLGTYKNLNGNLVGCSSLGCGSRPIAVLLDIRGTE